MGHWAVYAGTVGTQFRIFRKLRVECAMARRWDMDELVRIENTSGGPVLFIGDVLVRSWTGCFYDDAATQLAAKIEDAISTHQHQRMIEENDD